MAKNSKLTSIKCSACGGDLSKSSKTVDEDKVLFAKCLSCKKEYDIHTKEYYMVFNDTFNFDKDNSVFKLGKKGKINGIEYEITGRIRYQEEDEYEKSTWDEWFAVSSDGTYHYLVEEDGDVSSYEDYIPQSIDMETDIKFINFDGKQVNKNTAFTARLVFAEGELPWKPEIGDQITCYDIKKDGSKYSIELSDGEVSVTKGIDIPYKDIINSFGSEDHKKLIDATVGKRNLYKKKYIIYLLCMLVSLGFFIYSCAGDRAVQGVMNGKKVLLDNELKSDEGQTVFESRVFYGPFELDKNESLYNIKISIDEQKQRLDHEWQSIRLMLIPEDSLNKVIEKKDDIASLKNLFDDVDAQPDPVECYVVNGDFWDESGSDSEGSWHESDLSAGSDFVLDSAGRYYAYLESFSAKKRLIDSLKIEINHTSSGIYFLIIFFIFLVLFLWNISKSKSYNAMPFEVGNKIVKGDEK
jgi:hypothetical protein